MREYRFKLAITPDEYLAHYQGVASRVVVQMGPGPTIQFPANALRPFILEEGIFGEFLLRVDANNKIQSLKKIVVSGQ